MFDFFTSDTHFGHRAIIDLCGRPYQSVDQMNEALVNNYNSVVGVDDCVLWAGDAFFMSFDKSKAILDRLNGTKALVIGNHDRSADRMAAMGFAMVCDMATISIAGRTVKVCHYPYKWAANDERCMAYPTKQYKNEILMHGHTHSSSRVIGNMIHVGCDAWNYTPASLTSIEKLILEL